jgi:hypothetical protein
MRAAAAIAPLAATLTLATAPPAAGPPAPPTVTLPDKGLAWTLPPGWRDVAQQLTGVSEPPQQLAAATFALRQTKPDKDCSPSTARRQLPPDGVLVMLLESRDAAGVRARLRNFPPRPRHFRLRHRDIRPYECLGPGINLLFRAHDRAFYAMAMVGPRAPRSRLAEAERLLDSLVVQPIPPPPPPARWPTISTEAGDGMSVPFGWRSASLDVPRRLPRPRLLFWTANHALPQHPSGRRPWLGDPALPARLPDDGVAVWVVERPRGPAAPKPGTFAPAPAPPGANYSVRRAQLAVRGYRFEVSVLTGPRARPRDVARADTSARSLAVSSVGRQCHATAIRRRPDLCAATANRLLARQPYMGVSCHVPNSVTCDRIGLAVWLRRPAHGVTARINGRRVVLDDPQWSLPQDPRGPLFAGFLHPAGLRDPDGPLGVPGPRWYGVPPRSAWVELQIDGHATGLVVPLQAGWG